MLNPRADLADIADLDDRDRVDRIRRAWDAYYGNAPEPLKKRKGESVNDNVRLNYARLIVDAGVAHLFGDQLMIDVDTDDESGERIEDAAREIVRTNGGDLLWQRLGLSGGIGGTMFARIQPQQDGTIRIVCLDPGTVELEWAPDDYEIITKYTISWNTVTEAGGVARRQVITPNGNGWIIIDQQSIEGGWMTLAETDWPKPYSPIVHAQNLPSPHEVYGISDLEPDVLRLCSSVERVASNVNRVVRLYAHPRTWGKMIGDPVNMDASPGSVLQFENPNAELRNLEMQSDLASSIDLYRRLVAALHETTRIPEVATGKLDNAGQLSGLALRILYAPLIQKTESKRRTYGHAITELMRRCLDLQGYGDQIIVTLGWPALVPTDPEAERRTAIIDNQLGVSKHTLLERLGYDAEAEMVQSAEESASAAQEASRAFNAGQV